MLLYCLYPQDRPGLHSIMQYGLKYSERLSHFRCPGGRFPPKEEFLQFRKFGETCAFRTGGAGYATLIVMAMQVDFRSASSDIVFVGYRPDVEL